jgi:hypothetical protein
MYIRCTTRNAEGFPLRSQHGVTMINKEFKEQYVVVDNSSRSRPRPDVSYISLQLYY